MTGADAERPVWARGLDGRVALVTGAGRGLGRACALALAEAGARVIGVARTAADLDALIAEAPAGRVEAWIGDVTAESFYARVEALERLDVLVNNAGTNVPELMADVAPETLDRVLALNVTAAFRTAQSAARVMLRQGSGCIVHMSSQMGHVGGPKRTVYCMTKHAIEGLNKAMALELAPHGIRVNAVAPTFIETPLTRPMLDDPEFARLVLDNIPLGRLGTPQDVAAAVVYLASPAAAMVTGESLKIDGGWTAR